MTGSLKSVLVKARAFEKEAHGILSYAESAASRVITIEESYRKLTGLSLKQDELFRQALRCTEQGLFRAAHCLLNVKR